MKKLLIPILLILALCACSSQDKSQASAATASSTYIPGAFDISKEDPEQPDDKLPAQLDTDKQEKKDESSESVVTPPLFSKFDTSDESVPLTESQVFSNDAGTSIDVLREEIGYTTAQFGAAYIGYLDSTAANETGIDFSQWFYGASSELNKYYPFVSEIDEAHTIGTYGHLYCITAKDYYSSITVKRNDGELLYQAENGDPILLFCNLDGDAQTPDTTVIVTLTDGTEYQWEPSLDELGFIDLLIGDEREILLWDFMPIIDEGIKLEEWLVNGWLGPTAVGLAYDSYGTDWWIKTWDNSVSYCLSFYLNESNGYDGDVVLQCFYENDPTLQAEWQGQWYIETEMDSPSQLFLDLSLSNGADMASYEDVSFISESYVALVPLSGEYLLLVAGNGGTILPIFPEGVQAVELTLGVG